MTLRSKPEEENMTYHNQLPLRVKLCYSAGSFAKAAQGLMISVFLLYFYTDCLKLPPDTAANIIFWGRIWDIINDPIAGAIIDHTHSRHGRCRFFLRWFSIPAGVLLTLCFIAPQMNQRGLIVWALISFMLQSCTSTITAIPINTLMGHLSSDATQRAQLNQLSLFMSLAANYLFMAYMFRLIDLFGHGDLRHGYLFAGIIFGLAYAIPCMVVYWGTRGYETVGASEGKIERTGKEPLYLRALLSNRIWIVVCIIYLFYTAATVMENNAMVYYFQYVFGSKNMLTTYSAVSTACNLIMFFALPRFVKRFGNSGCTAIGCSCGFAGHLIRFVLRDGTAAVRIAGWGVSNLGIALVSGTVMLNIFDSVVYGEWKTGVKHDALLISGFTVASKAGMAIGGASVGWLLSTVPYVESAAKQASEVLELLFRLNTLVPAAVFAAALLLVVPLVKNEKRIPQMRNIIALRSKENSSYEEN